MWCCQGPHLLVCVLYLQDYKSRGIQLILTNPSPRVIRLLERSGVINKIGRDWIFVRVHDAVISCQRSLMQMEAGGSLEPTWRPMGMATPVYGNSSGGGNPRVSQSGDGSYGIKDTAMALAEGLEGINGGPGLVQMSQLPDGTAPAAASLDRENSL